MKITMTLPKNGTTILFEGRCDLKDYRNLYEVFVAIQRKATTYRADSCKFLKNYPTYISMEIMFISRKRCEHFLKEIPRA